MKIAAVLPRCSSAVLPRFVRGAIGIAFSPDVALSAAHAPEGPHESSKWAAGHKRAYQAHVSSAVASAVLPRWRLLGLDSYEILEVLPVLLL